MKALLYTATLALGIAMSQPSVAGAQIRRDTIAFFLKKSRIYLKGELNEQKDLDLMFDLGAGMTCINNKSVAIPAVRFDGTINVQNTNGINRQPSASRTQLRIAGLEWNNVPVVQVNNLNKDDDMIVGNSLFKNKVLEIDYDKKIIILTNTIQKDLSGYSKIKVTYYQDRPLFTVQVRVGNRLYPFPFLFDTGRDGTMLIGDDFTSKFAMWDKYHTIVKLGNKKIVVIPELKIGTRTFRNIVTNANDPQHPNGKQSLIGNELLNQFNVILDNRNSVIYLKPNANQNEDYATFHQLNMQAFGILGLVIILVAILFYLIRNRFRT